MIKWNNRRILKNRKKLRTNSNPITKRKKFLNLLKLQKFKRSKKSNKPQNKFIMNIININNTLKIKNNKETNKLQTKMVNKTHKKQTCQFSNGKI